jgi:carbonic anhydrase
MTKLQSTRTLTTPRRLAAAGGSFLLLAALFWAWPARASEPAHGADAHAPAPAMVKPAPESHATATEHAPAAATPASEHAPTPTPKPAPQGPLSLEQDAARIATKLQAAINRANTRQRAQAHVADTRTAKADTHGTKPRATHDHKAVDANTAHQAATQGHTEPHWSYTEPGTGPDTWAQLKPEFSACATGERQSPVHIQEAGTLQGPAEPLVFDYQPSSGSVVNNGHTIQVDLDGNNTLTVRGSSYKLVQFHFHHPAEEKVNYKGFAMVAHLVHKNAEGQLAVVAVLIDPGMANALVNKVWTHMPLDVKDRVRVPEALFDMKELLPQDARYYQFMGSLTTPPCTEGVLWMVMKQPMTVSREQLKLFSQLFPMNARPTQALNGRVVREAL